MKRKAHQNSHQYTISEHAIDYKPNYALVCVSIHTLPTAREIRDGIEALATIMSVLDRHACFQNRQAYLHGFVNSPDNLLQIKNLKRFRLNQSRIPEIPLQFPD